ncbi:MAG TPA: LysM peptidoglycan-binding domain-containing protein [Verrucomicrobiae bacterium]|nr:LysM peptidoglycan-binding domain-containing protein [Verrucomicrobiae bacterium]
MNNPNPFVPKGSLLEQQSHRRSRLKLGVFCVLAVSITGLVAMLIQGCKREQPPTDPGVDTNPPVMSDTNSPVADTNAIAVPPAMPTNSSAMVIPPPVVEPVAPVAPVAPAGDYAVAKGDTLGNIAKAHHVSLKDLQAANPGVDSKHLKIGQKLVIPASTSATTASPTASAATAEAGGDTYTVKSGDTLTTIAKKHGTTVKALQAANSLSTTKIKVGQKLKLPASASAAPAPAPAPVMSEPAPAPAPMTIPAPAPAPAK